MQAFPGKKLFCVSFWSLENSSCRVSFNYCSSWFICLKRSSLACLLRELKDKLRRCCFARNEETDWMCNFEQPQKARKKSSLILVWVPRLPRTWPVINHNSRVHVVVSSWQLLNCKEGSWLQLVTMYKGLWIQHHCGLKCQEFGPTFVRTHLNNFQFHFC